MQLRDVKFMVAGTIMASLFMATMTHKDRVTVRLEAAWQVPQRSYQQQTSAQYYAGSTRMADETSAQRYFGWVLRSLLNPDLMKVEVPGFMPLLVVRRPWWRTVENGQWEPQTISTLKSHVDSNTVYVDFGTWIGPTLLLAAQRSRIAIGLEGDPIAFAEASVNVLLNRNVRGISDVRLNFSCIATTNTVTTMRSVELGNSGSGIGPKVAGTGTLHSWIVSCISLPTLFSQIALQPTDNIFIKVDVESYECILVDALLIKWIKSLPVRVSLLLALHEQITRCSDDQYQVMNNLLLDAESALCLNSGASVVNIRQCALGELLVRIRPATV